MVTPEKVNLKVKFQSEDLLFATTVTGTIDKYANNNRMYIYVFGLDFSISKRIIDQVLQQYYIALYSSSSQTMVRVPLLVHVKDYKVVRGRFKFKYTNKFQICINK